MLKVVINLKNTIYEYFNTFDDYQKLINDLKKPFFSKLKNAYLSDEETERTNKITGKFNAKNGEELTRLYLRVDVILPICVFEKLI